MEGMMQRMMQRLPVLAALDADSDGVITAEEIENASEALSALDENDDGQLDAEELRPGFAQRGRGGRQAERPRRPRGAEGRSELQDRRRPEGRARSERRAERRPESRGGRNARGGRERRPGADRDQGARRAAPDPDAMVERWMEFDQDDDGKLSREELRAMVKQRIEQRRGRGGRGERRE